jgi:hypothetical protein
MYFFKLSEEDNGAKFWTVPPSEQTVKSRDAKHAKFERMCFGNFEDQAT